MQSFNAAPAFAAPGRKSRLAISHLLGGAAPEGMGASAIGDDVGACSTLLAGHVLEMR